MEQWKVDVIIPTYKPDGRFTETIKRLLKQTYPVHHIYIINTLPQKGESKLPAVVYENTEKITVTEIPQKEFNHGGTRNAGVAMSQGDFVLMMTQDAVPKDDKLIENFMDAFADEQVAVSYARQLATKEVGIIEQYTRIFNYPKEGHVKEKKDLPVLGIKTFFCSDVCAIYRKEIYEKMGGFVTKTIFNEDMIMASKIINAGYRIAYVANAEVYHAHKYTGKQQFQRNFDLGVSHREYREIFEQVKSESEGIKMVKQTAGYLLKKGKPHLVIYLIWQSGCKFLGYRLGKKYDTLPMWVVKRASSQKSYWE